MAAESIWPGMFQAEAGTGNTASIRSTRDAISDTVPAMPYLLNRARKRFWTIHQSAFQNRWPTAEVQIKLFIRRLSPTSYHNQALLDEGPKIAPMYFSSATLNLTTT
jgi:hypothetical protein